MILPLARIPAKTKNPAFLVIFSKPKAGKTSSVAALDGNFIVCLEKGGCEHVDAMYLQALNMSELNEVASLIAAKNKEVNGYAYKYITIDSGTALEEIVRPLALKMYQDTPMGKNYTGDILKLPNGSFLCRCKTSLIAGNYQNLIILRVIIYKMVQSAAKSVSTERFIDYRNHMRKHGRK